MNVQLTITIPEVDPDLGPGSRFKTTSGDCVVTDIQPVGNARLIWGKYGKNGVPQPHPPEAIVVQAPSPHYYPGDRVVVSHPPEGEPDLQGRTGTVIACVQIDGVFKVKIMLDGDQLSRRLPFEYLEIVERGAYHPDSPSLAAVQPLALQLSESDRRTLAQTLLNSLPVAEGASTLRLLKPQSDGYVPSGWVENPPVGTDQSYRFRWKPAAGSTIKRPSRKLKTPLEIKLFQWLTQPQRSCSAQYNLNTLTNLRGNIEETLDTLESAGIISEAERLALLALQEQEAIVQRAKAELGLNRGR